MIAPDGSSLSEEQQTMESISRSLAGGRYRLMRLLGAGAMGSVRLAEDTALHRRVAIKTVKEEVARNSEIRKRIERECLLHAKVGPHPNIVTLFDKLEFDDEMHLVMEYIDGETLQARLERNAEQGIVMPPAESILIASQVLDALSRIHAQGIFHRDIKPSNIMLTYTESGSVCAKLMDFGVSRFAEHEEGLSRLTTTDTGGPGTPLYMAPEQIDSKTFGPVTYAADVYAVGILLYQLLTGKPPYHGTITEVLNGHLNMPLPKVSVKLDGVLPETIENLLRRALAKKTADRIQTAKAFREELLSLTGVGDTMSRLGITVQRAAAAQSQGLNSPSMSSPGALTSQTFFGGSTVQRIIRFRRSMRVLGVGAAFVLLALVGTAIYFLRGPDEEIPQNLVAVNQPVQGVVGVGIASQPLTNPPAPVVTAPPPVDPATGLATTTTTTGVPAVTTGEMPGVIPPAVLAPDGTIPPTDASATVPQPGIDQANAAMVAYAQPTGLTAEAPTAAGPVIETAMVQDPNAPTTETGREHVVVGGDTLRKIAGTYSVSVSDIQWWNNILNPATLKVGQVLLLYAKADLPPKEEFMAKYASAEKSRKDAVAKKQQEGSAPAPTSAPSRSEPTLEHTFQGSPTPAPVQQKQQEKPRRGFFRGIRGK